VYDQSIDRLEAMRMDNSRRDFIKLGAAVAAVGAALPAEQAQATTAPGPVPNTAAGKLRLVTFAPDARAAPRVGVVTASGKVVDLGAAARKHGVRLSFDAAHMAMLIAGGERALQEVRKLAAASGDEGAPLGSVRLLPPIPRPPRNVYAVGWNYLEHFEEGQAMRESDKKVDFPEHPVFFTKGTHTVNGPYDPIPFDAEVSSLIDWECELAVVIGKRGRNIPEAEAIKHVFGFTVINDTSARDLQTKRHGGQWFKGKSLDGHGPMGPWIIPAAELDYNNLHLITRVNGVVKQDASTKQMYFKVPRIIAELSAGLTLEPGDIIATGTPHGVAAGMKPPGWLQVGDVVEAEVEGIGILRNRIVP
jgi:2-keto-4-pentenoate hydratase/2-oxohepta-3-ene-1,7-dioic acid hydratase in catechol pathway